MRMRKRVMVLGAGVAAAVILIVGLSLAMPAPAARRLGPVASVNVDLARPDGLIDTESLSQLPRDVLAVPLFREVLTQDLVTYYEQHPGRLTLAGILRRLAWEHESDAGDWVLRTVLDEPAQVALWRGGDGKIRHWLIVLRRNTVSRIMQTAAQVALRDRYLTEVPGGFPAGGTVAPAYALQRSSRQTLLFAARGERLLIVSDAGMVLDRDGTVSATARPVLDGLLAEDTPRYYIDRFALEPARPRHRVVLAARYVSFGYQRFFPGVEAVRFDFGDGRWATRMRFDTRALPPAGFQPDALWRLAPVEPSVCFALPVDWAAAAALAPSLDVDEVTALAAASALAGPAAVCWYATSRLHTPLFVAPLARELAPDETIALETLFASAVGRGNAEAPAAPATLPDGSLLWRRRVQTFEATLARHPRALVFSPDARLVETVLGVADKRYPAVADVLPADRTVLAVVAARSLATLLETEIAGVPGANEPAFRAAAATHLVPRLAALKRHPTYALVLPAPPVSSDWTAVEWVEVRR